MNIRILQTVVLIIAILFLSNCSGASKHHCDTDVSDSTTTSDIADAGDAGDEGSVTNTWVVDDLDDELPGDGTEENPYRDLQYAIEQANDGDTILIRGGTFSATAEPYADPGCGNCDDATFHNGSEATRGFLITGKSLHLEGEGQDKTVLVTNAGYGVLFDEAGESSIQNLKITGGIRDADGKATDAGIVVRFTTLLVENVGVIGNDNLYTGPEDDPVVGVGGIFGREGSDLTVRNCIVEDNSWDGITLYRGVPGDWSTAPVAYVEGNRVGCTSQCVNPRGRGVGIAATWDAFMTVVGNDVHHYWKGIGAFGDTTMILHNNVVRDQVGWGVIASGNSTMYAYNNVVTRNGTTGMSAWNIGAKGSFVNNIVVANGTSPDEWVGKKAGIWMNTTAPAFTLQYNLVFGNADFDVCFGGYPNEEACIPLETVGTNGNIGVDPLFEGPFDFHLKDGSPAIDAGDPTILDPDSSRSDIGIYGGIHALE